MNTKLITQTRQQGSVIIVTLWTITLLTILITALAGQVRLSARVTQFHQDDLDTWSKVLAAINQAEMELVLEQMPLPPPKLEETNEIGRNLQNRYDGEELLLAYPQPEGITVRIYNHRGKINLREISRPRMRAMLEKRLGTNATDQIDDLMDAWGDWLDLNEDASANGAETEYYAGLEVPYRPRNGRLETVEEILQIRGFAEVFEGVDLDAAFTIYGETEFVDLNKATVEAMQLLPGLDDELIAEILNYRKDKDFTGNGDVAQLIPAENMALLRIWLQTPAVSPYYTIIAYKTPVAQPDAAEGNEESEEGLSSVLDDSPLTGFAEIVEVTSFTDPPKVLKIMPYQKVPIRTVTTSEDEARQ
jgi:general secretion pathway protein K